MLDQLIVVDVDHPPRRVALVTLLIPHAANRAPDRVHTHMAQLGLYHVAGEPPAADGLNLIGVLAQYHASGGTAPGLVERLEARKIARASVTRAPEMEVTTSHSSRLSVYFSFYEGLSYHNLHDSVRYALLYLGLPVAAYERGDTLPGLRSSAVQLVALETLVSSGGLPNGAHVTVTVAGHMRDITAIRDRALPEDAETSLYYSSYDASGDSRQSDRFLRGGTVITPIATAPQAHTPAQPAAAVAGTTTPATRRVRLRRSKP